MNRKERRATAATERVEMIKTRKGQPSLVMEKTPTDLFLIFKGKKIAKRGHPGTPQAGTWIPLEPGVVVTSPPDASSIRVEINGVAVH